jgi:sodium transport system permease protein
MNYTLIIFLKELKEVLRDKRTLMAMLVFPLLLVPSILSVSMSFQASQSEEAMNKELKVGFIDNGNGEEFKKVVSFTTDIKLIEGIKEADLKDLVKGDSLDAAIVLATTFDAAIKENRTAKIVYYFNSTDAQEIKQRIEGTIELYEKNLLTERLEELKLMDNVINPIEVEKKNVYTEEESIGKMIGGFLPYIFVLFCMMGAMYPTIDLFTGEKERNTIETLLTVPANRLQILLGKMGVVVISGVISGLMAIVGLYIAMKLNPDAEQVFVNIVNSILQPTPVLLIIGMLIPLTIFFGGAMIPIAIYAKSFKEAQSMIQPGLILVILPLAIGMMPGVQLNFGTAMIPVLNVALASKEIIAGTIDYGLLAVVFLSLIAIAAIGVFFSIKQFSKESNVLR